MKFTGLLLFFKVNYTELSTSCIEVVEKYEVRYSQNLKGYCNKTEQEKA